MLFYYSKVRDSDFLVLCIMSKTYAVLFIIFLSFLFACKDKERQAGKSENDIDAARNFIQSALYGDYTKARSYMLPDSVNEQRMNAIERVNLPPEEKKGLAGASIRILKVTNVVMDSVTVVIFSNSFKNNPDTLKVVKLNGQWLVDFKYLYDHDMDTLWNKPADKDSIK